MTVYRGKINCRKFSEKITEILKAEGYEEISTNIPVDGRVFRTRGTNGKSEFYIRLQDPVNSYLSVGVYEKYVPASGTGLSGAFTNGIDHPCIRWNYNTQDARFEVNYIINITKDRIILFVEGMKLETWSIATLTYIGLPKRYDPNDVDGNFASVACTTYNSQAVNSRWIALRNRALLAQQSYIMDSYTPARSYGWGEKMFYSPIFLGTANEGPRGEIDGLMVMESINQTNELRHLDTFAKNGKQYIVIVPYSSGNYHLNPGYTYLMEV